MISRQLSVGAILFLLLACSTMTQGLGPQVAEPTETLAPAYFPPGCEGVAPATVPAATQLARPTPSIQANRPIAHDAQLQEFDTAVNVINEVYVYPDFSGRDWHATASAHRAKVAAGLDTEAFYAEMQSMVQDLGDGHSHFESPVVVALKEAELAGRIDYVGIGILGLPDGARNNASIIAVFPDSPAEHAGLQPHDRLLTVDGLPLLENGTSFVYRLQGPECSALRLTIQSPNQGPRDVLLMRQRVEGSLPIDARLVPTSDGSRVGYILLPSFFDESIPGQVAVALKEFGALDGLILDNRVNGGGAGSVTEGVLEFFASGTLGEFRNRTESRPMRIEPNPIENSQTVPLVVLVGPNTISYGEIFSGVLQDSGRAKIVGQTTLGNVEVLHREQLQDGSQMWIAEETFDPAKSHADWEKTGIIPDVEAAAAWDTFSFDTDPALAASLLLLGHK